jgi:hypothetical protein
MEGAALFNSPAFGYRHHVATWSSLRRRRGFHSALIGTPVWNVAHSAGSGA